jgi:hypothetical protein
MTDGEKYFEIFCDEHGFKYEKIETRGEIRTPDYKLYIDDYLIITEVKDLEQNKEDIKALKEYNEKGVVVWGESKVGNRVRGKIISGKSQLKIFTKNKYPSILLLFDNRNEITPTLTDYEIKIGMFGFESIVLNRKNKPVFRKFSRKAQMTKDSRKYISCIGLLTKDNDKFSLNLFENYYTAIKIKYSILKKYNDINIFRLEYPPDQKYSDWVEI